MTTDMLITDKEVFKANATDFFNTIFAPALEHELGEIEIRRGSDWGQACNVAIRETFVILPSSVCPNPILFALAFAGALPLSSTW